MDMGHIFPLWMWMWSNFFRNGVSIFNCAQRKFWDFLTLRLTSVANLNDVFVMKILQMGKSSNSMCIHIYTYFAFSFSHILARACEYEYATTTTSINKIMRNNTRRMVFFVFSSRSVSLWVLHLFFQEEADEGEKTWTKSSVLWQSCMFIMIFPKWWFSPYHSCEMDIHIVGA